VAVGGLSRAAVATTIMGDNAIAMLQEEQHLIVPMVRAERLTMAEDNRLSVAPVLIKDCRAILRGSSCSYFFLFPYRRRSRHPIGLAAR
jgi:hypothetical protein